jgi:hypothetical protein
MAVLCARIMCMPGALRGQKGVGVSEPLGLEFQWVLRREKAKGRDVE